MAVSLNDRNAYVELTNPEDRGGLGWELGTCLWSPVVDEGGSRSWRIMESVKEGDVILHLAKINDKYFWTGISFVAGPLTKVDAQLPTPHKKYNSPPFQRIPLKGYTSLKNYISINDVFTMYHQTLIEIAESSPFKSFYHIKVSENNKLGINQKYLSRIDDALYQFFISLIPANDFQVTVPMHENQLPTENEPLTCDNSTPPDRIMTVVSRIVRDTKLSRDVKRNCKDLCQVCGHSIKIANNRKYSEAHHMIPLGGSHEGLDIKENIIVLCPNHHTEFDYGSIAIDPKDFLIKHIDINNEYHNKRLYYRRNDLSIDSLNYHFKKIFKG